MDRKRIKGVHHINIPIKDNTHIVTKENDSISTLDFRNLDEIATTFFYHASNEMELTKHSNHNSNQSETQYPSENKYQFLTQFGITTYLLNPTNRDTIRYILRDTEQLNYDHNLSFMRMNSTADFFKIPNFISSKKSYDNLKRKGRFVKEILECMSAVSNTSHTEYTNNLSLPN